MSEVTEKLFKGFVELCEDLVSDTYVITNGREVVTATLDHDIATKLCKLTRRNDPNGNWVVAKIPSAIEFAYAHGRADAIEELNQSGEEASNAAPEQIGETDGQDSQLREREIQHQEEPD